MPDIQVWVVDPLTKVFPADRRPQRGPRAIVIEAARNEVESGQVAVRSTAASVLRPIISPLVHADGDARIEHVRANPVGYVQLDVQTPDTPAGRIVHRAPGPFPDVLLDEPEVTLEAGQTRPLWLTVTVPPTAKPGVYGGELMLVGGRGILAVPIEVRVFDALLPDVRTLCLSQWFSADGYLSRHLPSATYPSEAFWRTMRAIARNMRAHRQNVVRIPFGPSINGPIAAIPTGIDGLAFDFSGFDRLVHLFIEEGAGDLIEGMHLGTRPNNNWLAPQFVVRGLLNVGGSIAAVDLKADTLECRHFLAQYLPALGRHLAMKGWTGRYVQHICDEPVDENAASYQALARTVRALLPGVRVIEAVHSTKLDDLVDIWVPQLDLLAEDSRFYRARQKLGNQVWFYTCCHPKGRFPNRFLDRGLLDVRLVHWMNFTLNATGYLHWGYNQWNVDNPSVQTHWEGLPGGDCWIVYPGREGVLDSIRHEAMRDGVEDYELLRLLERDHPRQAQTLAKSVVKSPTNYTTSVAAFRKARRRLLELLS
jgi:hypothetical protein